jgi:hypothetical protein
MADMSACSLGRLSEATNEAITPYFDENHTSKRSATGGVYLVLFSIKDKAWPI